MKLAANFSEELLSLLKQYPELPVDYIKVPTIPFPECQVQFEKGGKWRKLLPHPTQAGVLALGLSEPQQRFNQIMIQELIQSTNPPYLSTHLDGRIESFPEQVKYLHQSNPKVKQALKAHFLTAIKEVQSKLTVPLVLENFPYYTWWNRYRVASEAEFISEICSEGNCGFLLDIAHARCSAWYFEIDILDYITALPLDRLKEIHLTGTTMRVEGLRDTHTIPVDEDYRLLEYVLKSASPATLTLEYGGMKPQIRNINGEYEPISRNDPRELQEGLRRIMEIMGISARI